MTKEEIYQEVMRSLTTWHDRKLGDTIVYDDECVRVALQEAIKQSFLAGRKSFAKVSSNYSVGFKDGKKETLSKVMDILDRAIKKIPEESQTAAVLDVIKQKLEEMEA